MIEDDGLEDIFVANITDSAINADDEVTWQYTWTEQTFDPATGIFQDADSPRTGDKTTGPFLVELNNTNIKPPFFAWVRLRGIVAGEVYYEFDSGQDIQPGVVEETTTFAPTQTNFLYDIDATAGAVTVDLPPATGILSPGYSLYFRRKDATANTITIVAGLGDSLDWGGSMPAYATTVQVFWTGLVWSLRYWVPPPTAPQQILSALDYTSPTPAWVGGVVSQSGDFTVDSSQHLNMFIVTATANVVATLPASVAIGYGFGQFWFVWICSDATKTLTLHDPSSGTVGVLQGTARPTCWVGSMGGGYAMIPSGYSGVVNLAKLTLGGTAGTLTVNNGVIQAIVQPT